MENAMITFEVMSISETFVTVRLLGTLEGAKQPISQEVHCLKIGDTLNIPLSFVKGQ